MRAEPRPRVRVTPPWGHLCAVAPPIPPYTEESGHPPLSCSARSILQPPACDFPQTSCGVCAPHTCPSGASPSLCPGPCPALCRGGDGRTDGGGSVSHFFSPSATQMRSLLDRDKKKKKKKKQSSAAGLDVALGLVPQQQPRMFSCVSCFWVLLSACLVAVCSFSFLSPAWIVRSADQDRLEPISFGLLWHCSEGMEQMPSCYTFGGLGRFNDIPSSSWQTSAVLCSGGCALLVMSCLLAIVTLFLPSGLCERRLCTLAGYMQTAAVFIMASGLLVYPFGLNSTTVKKYCENSSIYYAGDCQIGWGYMLAIVGVMLSVFLPFFAKYAPKEHMSPTPIPTIL